MMEKVALRSQYVLNPEAYASILYKCISIDLGDVAHWEMETLSISMHQKYGDVPQVNLDKIMSIIALKNSLDGRMNFFTEMNCFRHTVNALNNLEIDHEFLGALMPPHIHWALYEIGLLFPEHTLHEEPGKFLALSYHYVGQLLLPTDLQVYQPLLDSYNENTELVPKIREAWETHHEIHTDNLDEEDIIHMQILLLRADEEYMSHKKSSYLRDSSAITE
jgi:hypothetical protein